MVLMALEAVKAWFEIRGLPYPLPGPFDSGSG